MTIRIDAVKVLDTLGENGERWTQGTWRRGDKLCLHGAIRRCQPIPGDAFLAEHVAARRGWGPAWNDDKSTTWSMVRERIAHLEVSDADLADTFGPQWEPIVAMVRRAAVLTLDEAERLLAAWDTARSDAWDAAWDAASAADLVAARSAAEDAVGSVHVAAAEYAATALAVRHLIGQHGFTQKHYDLLTGPWRTVIGPVHPDDTNVNS